MSETRRMPAIVEPEPPAVVVEEPINWRLRGQAAEEMLRRRNDAVLMRGEYLGGSVQRRHGYALLEDQLSGNACMLDADAVRMAAVALGIVIR